MLGDTIATLHARLVNGRQWRRRLRGLVAEDTAAVATIDDMMARSRTELGDSARGEGPTVIAPSEGMPAAESSRSEDDPEASTSDELARGASAGEASGESPASSAGRAAVDSGASVALTVALSDEARADTRPEETVFVYARASEGPPMPLAVSRHTVADLPVTVTLDESMAMMPTMSLARFPDVTVGARVSRTGEAIAAPGDWFAEREGVEVGAGDTVELVIDTRRP